MVLESVASVIRNENGEPEKLVIVNRDITERKKVQEALVRSEASFRSLVEGRWHYLHACRKHATAISTRKPAKR